jgi:DNA-binding transcriptional MerR regulator
MQMEENGFLDYLQLQGGTPELITKSDLIAEVRAMGQPVGDRQLTFYASEGLVPKSVRVGSRAGVYPKIVVELLAWILRTRDMGVPLDSIKELVPVWKYLIKSRRECRLDLGELEYVARQHVSATEACLAIPQVVRDVMLLGLCQECGSKIKIIDKDGAETFMQDRTATIGFAIARRLEDEEGSETVRWSAQTRITLAAASTEPRDDPTTVILGVAPNERLPERQPLAEAHTSAHT